MTFCGPYGFREVWAVDFEFRAPPGETPEPLCLVARELRSGREVRAWRDQLDAMPEPPYPTGPDSLFVAYFASAEFGCHLALGWQLPRASLDLFVEFRNLTNGAGAPFGNSLLGALAYFGLPGIEGMEKAGMRELAMRGGPYTGAERRALLDYCATDVDALARLLPRMVPRLDTQRAMLRSRFMGAVARIERNGIPLDTPFLDQMRAGWTGIQDHLIARVDRDFGVYEGRTFKADRFALWLARQGIPWPRTDTGRLRLDDDTFRDMARAYPRLAPLRELRASLGSMRLERIAVGADGRNRCLLSPYRAKTGRNQPSNAKFVFGPAVWLRGLIRPPAGHGLAYVDWSQQEFGIAAALSGDGAMLDAYQSGDPYLAFAKQAGAAPTDATKQSHREVRDQFKATALAVEYGMGAESLAVRIGVSVAVAHSLLRKHRTTYPEFWRFSDGAVDFAMLRGSLHTVFGWTVRVGPRANPRALRNFPMQGNGNEMLRLACIFASETGVRIAAPVHDAILIEAPLGDLERATRTAQECMARASRAVLSGFELRTDVDCVRYPDRYSDPRGARMWATVAELLADATV